MGRELTPCCQVEVDLTAPSTPGRRIGLAGSATGRGTTGRHNSNAGWLFFQGGKTGLKGRIVGWRSRRGPSVGPTSFSGSVVPVGVTHGSMGMTDRGQDGVQSGLVRLC